MNEFRCEHCGRKLDEAAAVWLELSFRTNEWRTEDNPHPAEESQGMFPFGRACARRVLREQLEDLERR